MIKEAQKKFKDPKRQSLEDRKQNIFKAKKLWNSYLKEFKKELKETQALINGRVEGKERIRIDQPLPEETTQSLSNLSDFFQKRIEEGNRIYQAQGQYSADYDQFFAELEQKRIKKMNQGQPLPQSLPQPAAQKEASLNSNLKKQAGIGPIRMFWENLKSLTSDSEGSRRTTLLGQLRNLDNNLSECEYNLTEARSQENLSSIRKKMYESFLIVKYLLRALDHSKKLSDREFGIQMPESENPYSSNDRMDDKVKNIKEDMREPYTAFEVTQLPNIDENKKKKVQEAAFKLKRNLHHFELKPRSIQLMSEIIENYDELIEVALGNNYLSFKDYQKTLRTANFIDKNIIKTSQSSPYESLSSGFKKWISSIGLRLNVFVPIRSNLIDAADELNYSREILNENIDDLKENESISYDLVIANLKKLAESLYESIDNIDSIASLVAREQVSEKELNKTLERGDKGLIRSLFAKMKSSKEEKPKTRGKF